jgi:hypothetical protein
MARGPIGQFFRKTHAKLGADSIRFKWEVAFPRY